MRSACARVFRRHGDAGLALGGWCVYLAAAPLAARDPERWERRLFTIVNEGNGSTPVLRVPQQLGTPWVLPAMSVFAFWANRPRLMVAAAFALPLEKASEVGIKKVTRRRRPAQVVDATLHDDAPTDGPSYPSGHAAIATCAAVLIAPYLPRWVSSALAMTLLATAYTRVHQGAHFPLDAAGGVAMGVGLGGALNYAFGVPVKRSMW